MSKGDSRRVADLANLEAEFADALALARKEDVSAYLAEKAGRPRRGASPLDVKLFTLESKIVRMRDLLGMPAFRPPIAKADPSKGGILPLSDARWDPAPALEGSVYPLDPRTLWDELKASGREPHRIFAKVKCGGGRTRQSEASSFWRLATVECSDGKMPARLTLTLLALPDGPDAAAASRKLEQSLDRLVEWSQLAVNTVAEERPRLLQVNFTRSTRELQFSAR